jgi:hypothetical protein
MADIQFEDLYTQIKLKWINGWKDDRRLANYSHYPSLRCGARRVDLADYSFGSCKDVNGARGDCQSANNISRAAIDSRI